MVAQACGGEGAAGIRGDAAESEALHCRRVRARSPRLRRSPSPEPLALTLTLSRLLLYGGRNLSKPLLLALKGRVLDVSAGSDCQPNPNPNSNPRPNQVSAGSEYYGLEGSYQLTNPCLSLSLSRPRSRSRSRSRSRTLARSVPADGRQGRQLRLRHDVSQGGGCTCQPGWHARHAHTPRSARPARHGPLGPGFAAPELGSCTSSRRACLAALGSSGLESPRGASALPLGA